MPKYSIKANGNIIKFRSVCDSEARLKAFRMNPYYSNFKRLESRWWLLVYPVLFLLGLYGVGLL